jgi:hypothetical protein
MKKLLLTIVAICTAELASAQGRVGFNNASTFNSSDAITISYTNFGSAQGLGGQGIGGDKYSVQLIWVAGTGYNQATFEAANPTYGNVCTGVGTGSAGAAFFAATGNVASGAGFFDAGSIPNPVGTSMPPGLYTMQVLAWYNLGHSTYQSANAAGNVNTGKSGLFVVNATASPTQINSTVFPGFTVSAIPEPSMFSVAALTAAVLLFRRKK